jgi:hypothetical protein
MNINLRVAAAALLASISAPAFACSTCGCNLTADWLNQGITADNQTTLSLRYDYVPQTQLRSGTSVADRATFALPNDLEIEQYTYNHYVTASLDHSFGHNWAINVQLPYLDRPHKTVSLGDTDPSYSATSGLGDVRVSARYQGFGGPGVTGIQFGLKLPTGGISQNFKAGPSAGQIADTTLQVGQGTTNAILGFYHLGTMARNFDYLVQVQGDVPLNARAQYRPGDAATVSVGTHYLGWRGVTPQLIFNLRLASRDSGLNADTVNTGGEQLYVAPGLSFKLAKRVTGFAIVQLPLYERVNGLQITPHETVSVGLSYRL